MAGTAVLSPDRVYRYSLTRVWDVDGPPLVWVGLNPSTADADTDDPTIRREVDFTKRWGFGGLIKVNLFAFRATKPAALVGQSDPIGPDNDATLWQQSEDCEVVAAWGGSLPDYWRPRAHAIAHRLRKDRRTFTLGFTKTGQPRHPLYVPRTVTLTRWEPSR
jgi:hypothetical protein